MGNIAEIYTALEVLQIFSYCLQSLLIDAGLQCINIGCVNLHICLIKTILGIGNVNTGLCAITECQLVGRRPQITKDSLALLTQAVYNLELISIVKSNIVGVDCQIKLTCVVINIVDYCACAIILRCKTKQSLLGS